MDAFPTGEGEAHKEETSPSSVRTEHTSTQGQKRVFRENDRAENPRSRFELKNRFSIPGVWPSRH